MSPPRHATLAPGWWPVSLTPPPAGAALQTPCGDAAWLLHPTWQRWTRVGADPIPQNLTAAREAAALSATSAGFLPALSWDLPFADESFALIASAGALETAPDPEAALVELLRLLTPGGRLLLAWGSAGDGLHYPSLRSFDLALLDEWCGALGLDIARHGVEDGLSWAWIAGPRG